MARSLASLTAQLPHLIFLKLYMLSFVSEPSHLHCTSNSIALTLLHVTRHFMISVILLIY